MTAINAPHMSSTYILQVRDYGPSFLLYYCGIYMIGCTTSMLQVLKHLKKLLCSPCTVITMKSRGPSPSQAQASLNFGPKLRL